MSVGNPLANSPRSVEMSRFDGMVELATKRGLELVDRCAREQHNYNLEDVIYNHFNQVVSEIMPKRFTMKWATEMMLEKPKIFTFKVAELGFQPDDIREIVQYAVHELVSTAALKAGFISEEDPDYLAWANRRGYI